MTVPQVLTNGNYASTFDEYSLKYTHGKWEYYNKGKQDYARSGIEAALSLYDIQNDQISIEHGQKTWKDINNIDRYSQKVASGQLEPITCIIGYESKENTTNTMNTMNSTNTPLLSFNDTKSTEFVEEEGLSTEEYVKSGNPQEENHNRYKKLLDGIYEYVGLL